MATRRLPRRPDLAHLRDEARDFQRAVRRGDPEALADLEEHDPTSVPRAAGLPLSKAQLVVARRYGFRTWTKLIGHVDTVNRLTRVPQSEPAGESPAEQFTTLACLTYAADGRHRVDAATAMLDDEPGLCVSDIYAAAAAGDIVSTKALLDRDPGLVSRQGGPHSWTPLLYAAFSRIAPRPGRSTLAVARLLVDAGADPNAGYLWDGAYPFTALTGAFGGGEDAANQPRHPESAALARLLLQAGADPNDTQTLYNRMFWPDDEHLEVLFEFGLGGPSTSPWAVTRQADAMTVEQNLAMVLQHAARQGFDRRVRLLLDHGVAPDADSGHPIYRGALAYELAMTSGHRVIADMLLAAGAEPVTFDAVATFAGACMQGNREEATRLLAEDLTLVGRAEAESAPLHRACSLGRADAIRLMLDVGFSVNGLDAGGAQRTTPLHEAVSGDQLAIVGLLLEAGADPTIRDQSFDATPLGWAEHFGNEAIAASLRRLVPDSAGPVSP